MVSHKAITSPRGSKIIFDKWSVIVNDTVCEVEYVTDLSMVLYVPTDIDVCASFCTENALPAWFVLPVNILQSYIYI